MEMKLLGTTNVGFDVISQRLIRFSISVRYWRKSGSIMAQFICSFTGAYSPIWAFGLPFWGFLITHIQTHGRTPLDE
jgi:hypothetical protein